MAKWLRELRELRRRPLNSDEIDRAIAAIQDEESDRGCALIAGSMAENFLESLIRSRMRQLNKELSDQIFMGEGILSGFSAKIKISFAFNIIDAGLRGEFDKIREIRNTFAHSKSAITFSTPEVKMACVGLLQSSDSEKINARALYSNSVFMITHGTVMALKGLLKDTSPISYNEVVTSFYTWFQQPHEQIQGNPPEGNIQPTQPARP